MTKVTYEVKKTNGEVVKVNTKAEAIAIGKIEKVCYEPIKAEPNRYLVEFRHKYGVTV